MLGSTKPKESKQINKLAILATTTTFTCAGLITYAFWGLPLFPSEVKQEEISIPQIKTVTALGRLEPKGELIQLSAPTSAQGSRVEQLLVKEGDSVKAGRVIAILDTRDTLAAALEEAKGQVRVAEANLAKVKAGAQIGEIEAQRAAIARIKAERDNNIKAQAATVARLEAQLSNAKIEDRRHQMLYQQGAISSSLRDSKRLEFETAQRQLQEAKANEDRIRLAEQQQLREAKATLDRISEVRPVDIEIARAEVNAALAAVKRAQAELDRAYVKAPKDSEVLKIYTRPGELVSSSEGIADLGETSQMYAVAEVYESDINKVRLGQQVRLTSNSLTGELQGSVERIGTVVLRQNVVNTDPSENIDARVIEVKVRLDKESSQKVARLTNLQVKVRIEL